MMKEIFEKLKAEMPYKWRKGPKNSDLAYIDSRDVQNRLDDVIGPENWKNEFAIIDNKLFCGISINVGKLQNCPDCWVCKWDTGTESNIEKEKGEVSDAFKRSAVMWGIGRFLYSLKEKPAIKKEPVKGSQGEKTISNNTSVISESQAKLLYVKAKDIPTDIIKSLIKDICGVESSKDIPKDKFNKLLEEIEKI